jgi:hypothetical protein
MPNRAEEFHKIFLGETLEKSPRISSGFRLDSVHIKAVQKSQRNHGRFPALLPNVSRSKYLIGPAYRQLSVDMTMWKGDALPHHIVDVETMQEKKCQKKNGEK